MPWENNKYYVCVCVCIHVLVIGYTKRIYFVPYCLSPLVSLTLPCFSAVSHKRHEFSKEITDTSIMFCFSLQQLPETFLILRRIHRDTGWRTKCHIIDCARNTFLLLQNHLTSDTE